ncbi:MAG: YopX family protein [Mediterraneibacter gnavus]
MSREILFKAKRIDNGEWVEGDLERTKYDDVIWIVDVRGEKCYRCDLDTICQYIGLTDKNDKKIWENDIVELPDEEGYFTCKWEEDAARFVMNGDGLTVDFDNYWSYQTEVAGNIFDNPELLGVE